MLHKEGSDVYLHGRILCSIIAICCLPSLPKSNGKHGGDNNKKRKTDQNRLHGYGRHWTVSPA